MSLPEKLTPSQAVRLRMDELRAEYNISYHRIAVCSGVPYSTVKSYLSGNAGDITLGTLISLANFFGMTLREFADSDYFDIIDVAAVRRRKGMSEDEGLKDFRELRKKSEEWVIWNNSQWWYRDDM